MNGIATQSPEGEEKLMFASPSLDQEGIYFRHLTENHKCGMISLAQTSRCSISSNIGLKTMNCAPARTSS